jgi:hypothetical protein
MFANETGMFAAVQVAATVCLIWSSFVYVVEVVGVSAM